MTRKGKRPSIIVTPPDRRPRTRAALSAWGERMAAEARRRRRQAEAEQEQRRWLEDWQPDHYDA